MSSLLMSSTRSNEAQRQPSSSSQQPPSIPHHTSAASGSSDPSSSSDIFSSSSSNSDAPSIWHSISNPSSNPLLSAGFSLMIFGAALGLARKGATSGAAALQRRMLVSLEIPSKDRAHGWLLKWMEEQARLGQAMPPLKGTANLMDLLGMQSGTRQQRPIRIISRDLAVQTTVASTSSSANQVMTMNGQPIQTIPGQSPPTKSSKPQFSLVPGPGTHFFRYGSTWIRLTRERSGKMVDMSTGAPWETLTLTTLNASRSVFSKLLAEAKESAERDVEGKTIIYTAWGVEWRAFGQPRKVRELESVVLSAGQRDRLYNDLVSFLNRGEWYARRGIPYRRGHLLHGSPGSGKTSIIQALAGRLGYNICLLNLAERGLTDDRLNHLLALAPEKSILLLEDIDAAFPSRTAPTEDGASQKREYQTSVTFSGLLNALDGVASGESRIVMMTTNHVDRLDPALIRPGRVDLIEELGDADEGMARELFGRFYSPSTESEVSIQENLEMLSDRLAKTIEAVSLLRRRELGLDDSGRFPRSQQQEVPAAEAPSMKGRTKATPLPAKRGGVSMAELQGLFIRYPADPKGAIEELEIEQQRGSGSGST